MLKNKKVFIAFIICILLFMQVSNTVAYGKSNITEILSKKEYIHDVSSLEVNFSESAELEHGSLFLSNRSIPKTNNWLEVEKIIHEKMQNREENIEIIYTGATFYNPMQKLKEIIDKIIKHDHYIYYNIATYLYYTVDTDDNVCITIKAGYRTTKAQEEFVNSKVREILSNIIKPGMNERDKIKAIHDYMVLNLKYDESYSRYTAYDALKDGEAVCLGYSLLGYKMLNEVGIPTRIISSENMNHAWNLVKLDGKWYHLDITWDDPIPDVKGRIRYSYFLLTDEEMGIDHYWEPDEYPTSGEGMIFENKPSVIGWFKHDGKWYYMNSDGSIATGWKKVDGKWYYMDKSGAMQTGWQKVENKWYYFSASGAMQTGWQKIGDRWYYFTTSGVMQTGWQKLGGQWYYFGSSGAMQTGWQEIGGKWYYFNTSGAMQTGWKMIGGKWYYFSASGAMQTGWKKVGGKWYYFNTSGVMQTGWQEIGGQWYYFSASGAMQTGWQKVGGKWYYFNSSGAMQTGWKKIEGYWYYFSSSGAMKTGWLKLGDKYYYFESDGKMVTGEYTINGKVNKFSSSGVWLGANKNGGWTKDKTGWRYKNEDSTYAKSQWKKIDGNWYYFDSKGYMTTGWKEINGKWYYFSSTGAMQTGWIKWKNNWYYLDSSGVMVTGQYDIDGITYVFGPKGNWIKPLTDEQIKKKVEKNYIDFKEDLDSLVKQINESRVDAGLKPIVLDVHLSNVAMFKAIEMAHLDMVSYMRPNGQNTESIFSLYGINPYSYGMIIGKTHGKMNSLYIDNILDRILSYTSISYDPDCKKIGIGIAEGNPELQWYYNDFYLIDNGFYWVFISSE